MKVMSRVARIVLSTSSVLLAANAIAGANDAPPENAAPREAGASSPKPSRSTWPKTREQVRDEVLQARKDGTLVPGGLHSAPPNVVYHFSLGDEPTPTMARPSQR